MPQPTTVTTPALRAWRIRRALLQHQLAERAGLDLGTVQRLEAGHVARLDTVAKLAAVLRVSPELLMQAPPDA